MNHKKWVVNFLRKKSRQVIDKSGRARLCIRCGVTEDDGVKLTVHHLNGNVHDRSFMNLELLCEKCHRLEHLDNPTPTPDELGGKDE